MYRRVELLGLTVTTIALILLFATVNQRPTREYPRHYPVLQDLILTNSSFATVPIKTVVRQNKFVIEQQLKDYPFPKNKTLTDFTLSVGGKPVRNIIITTWRSGSTFLGEVLNAIPGNYYHYEPLLHYGIMQIRGPPFADSAVTVLESLLKCEYDDLQAYLKYGQDHVYLFTHNTRLWTQCEYYPNYCWDPDFLMQFCKLFPFQSMKVVRLRLRLAERLLLNKDLNVRVLLLVRDPRGILQSRKHREWCPGIPDCDQPNILCADMVSDYSAAIKLKHKFPHRFSVIRYEDLSLNPYNEVKKLLQFFNLYFHPNVMNFLDSHTRINYGGLSSTFRNSKNTPFHWRMDLNFSEVQYIEEQCTQAMHLWGYVKAYNETNLKEFNPLTEFTLDNE
ncbi:carbohydrate sulfotransferase 4 [Agrilus planipennis]|uniref:Carbohydrate sulfotransferase 4 n=1 Tax=Agrilus planipennis TaxID=224129 RepID=A0A1W4WH07_AGRPL|nr:carbohydrate sulfotransferase 4 [Agrilus planipennis]